MTVKVFTLSHLPDDLMQQWLQHLRDFDTEHPGCHFEVLAEAPEMTMSELIDALKVDPGLEVNEVISRRRQ